MCCWVCGVCFKNAELFRGKEIEISITWRVNSQNVVKVHLDKYVVVRNNKTKCTRKRMGAS